MTLEEKGLLTGRDFWTTSPMPKIGLRRMVFSDGPSGVRGEVWDERSPSLNLTSVAALSSSWDAELAYRYGTVLAAEARRKGVAVVLGPTINLHRSPLGGRHFEAFSEDPALSADLAAAYVLGLQDHGVGATLKHYVALPLPGRSFADWRPGGWHYEPGTFDVLVGTSAADLPLAATVERDDSVHAGASCLRSTGRMPATIGPSRLTARLARR